MKKEKDFIRVSSADGLPFPGAEDPKTGDGAVLTIVVPAYNAEKTIRTALDSLLIPGLMEKLEVLVINDGSTDGTEEAAREYCERFPGTFRLISKPNGGHGSGINCGILLSRGRYFKVMDADDWVSGEALASLVGFLENTGADIVWSGFYWVYEQEGVSLDKLRKKKEFVLPFRGVEWRRVYEFDALADRLYIKMHNFTIRTSILKEQRIRVDEHCFYVDTEFTIYPIPYVKTVAFLPDDVYMYRIGRADQSMSREKMERNEKSIDTVVKALLRFYSGLGTRIPCTEEKKRYIQNLIARVIAGKYRIMLCAEPSRDCRRRMMKFDGMLKRRYPEVYRANINRAVSLLRQSRFLLYLPASLLGRMVYH